MTRAKRRANRFRWVILIVGVLYSLAAIGWLILPFYSKQLFDDFVAAGLFYTPLDPTYLVESLAVYVPNTEVISGAITLIFVGPILIAQWLFLRPGRKMALRLVMIGKPMKRAVVIAALMASLLSFGVLALILELTDNWRNTEYNYSLLKNKVITNISGPSIATLWGYMLVLWIIWTIIFWIYWRQGDRYTQLGKMIRALMAGSLIEAVIAIPVHVWVMRQRNCYCERGTYTTLVFSGTVLFWAFGPGIVLLFMKEKYRQAKLLPICKKCSYDLRGSGEVCPECGTKREALQNSPAD